MPFTEEELRLLTKALGFYLANAETGVGDEYDCTEEEMDACDVLDDKIRSLRFND